MNLRTGNQIHPTSTVLFLPNLPPLEHRTHWPHRHWEAADNNHLRVSEQDSVRSWLTKGNNPPDQINIPETHHNQLPLDMFSLHMKEINRHRAMIQGWVSDMTSEAMQGLILVGLEVLLRQLLKSPAVFLDKDRTCKILWFFKKKNLLIETKWWYQQPGIV